MKKSSVRVIIVAASLLLSSFIMAAGQKENKPAPAPQKQAAKQQPAKQQPAKGPVIININKGSSGGHNQNFPVQHPEQQKQQQVKQAPVYGKLQTNPVQVKRVQPQNMGNNAKVAVAVHHHPYEPNYVRKKLQNLGVKSAPGYIVNREEVIHTDRDHSSIAYPKTGFDNRPLNAGAYSPRHFNNKTIRAQMALVSSQDWQNRVAGFNQSETRPDFYYWHNENNFSYCHYIDNSGYHWYGWYTGGKYFWTRNFNNRWWWYDADFDRWCFWNDGFWWWQDPNHIGDLYCYNDATYVPVNSAEDNVAVALPDNAGTKNYTSPDNTRIVKVVADTQDAFLYDAANPPSFAPVYLASGVQDVLFSNAGNGSPLEIILKLNNQTFDMFDGNGSPYNASVSAETNSDTPQ
jgi:hypothetical protein